MNMAKRENKGLGFDMTEGKIFPVMLTYAAPLLLANLIQQLYSVADMVIVGQVVGSTGTVSVSTGGVLLAFLMGMANSFGNAAQVCSAQLWGAGKRESVGNMGTSALNASVLLGLVLGVICILITKPFMVMMNCPAEAFLQAESYMRIASLGLPFIFGYNIISGVLRGIGDSKIPMLFVAIAALFNVFMDLLMVAVFHLEAAGSAAATVTAQAMAFFSSLIYINRTRLKSFFRLRENGMRIRMEYLAPVMKIGIPLTLQFGCIQASQILCNSWVNSFGMTAAATTSIGNKISQFINVITQSINGAAGSMVAQNLGARKTDRVKEIVYAALKLTLLICAVEYVAALVFPEQLFSLFTGDPEVITLGRTYLRIALIMFFLNALQGPYTSVITGSGNAKLSFAAGILDGIVLRIGVAYLLAFVYGMGVVGYWYGNVLAHLGPIVVGVIYFYSGKWAGRRLAGDAIRQGDGEYEDSEK